MAISELKGFFLKLSHVQQKKAGSFVIQAQDRQQEIEQKLEKMSRDAQKFKIMKD